MSHNHIVRVHVSFHNITPFSGGTPTFHMRTLLSRCRPTIQLLCRCFYPIQCVSPFQPLSTCVFELSRLPHVLLDLANLLLIHKEEVGHLAEMCDLGDEQEVMDVFQRIVEPRPFVSAILETPKVVMHVPWSFSLIMVRDRIQGSSILTPVSGYDTNDMRVWTHNNSSVVHWDTPSLTVSDDAGDEIGPSIEIKS